jgi:hypothetical protein
VKPTVAILCTARNSVYKTIPGVDVYDIDRDAKNFEGGMPIVAHPPCRAWSAYCRHQAKPDRGEKELGLWCADQLRKWGGCLEQPAHSHLFKAAGLPLPGHPEGNLWSADVWQFWWGYPMRKATWICFSGIDTRSIQYPLRLHMHGNDRRRELVMSKNQRSATTLEFATWLIEAARMAT